MNAMIKFLKHPGNLIILGFIVFAVWMVYFSWKTSQVKFELAVEGDYYELEKDFDKRLAAENLAHQLGNTLNFKKDGDKLTLNIPSAISSIMDNGNIEFFCLSDSKSDTRQKLEKNEDGTYVFNRSVVAPGNNYIVKVFFSSSGKDYYKEFRMF